MFFKYIASNFASNNHSSELHRVRLKLRKSDDDVTDNASVFFHILFALYQHKVN